MKTNSLQPSFQVLSQSKMLEHLQCSICQDYFKSPKRIACGHTFCHACIKNFMKHKSKCPICRKLFLKRDIKTDFLANSMVGDIEVKCKLEECEWTGAYNMLISHQKSFHQTKQSQCGTTEHIPMDLDRSLSQVSMRNENIDSRYHVNFFVPKQFSDFLLSNYPKPPPGGLLNSFTQTLQVPSNRITEFGLGQFSKDLSFNVYGSKENLRKNQSLRFLGNSEKKTKKIRKFDRWQGNFGNPHGLSKSAPIILE